MRWCTARMISPPLTVQNPTAQAEPREEFAVSKSIAVKFIFYDRTPAFTFGASSDVKCKALFDAFVVSASCISLVVLPTSEHENAYKH